MPRDVMTWTQLLSAQRPGRSGPDASADPRSPFERDHARILFADSFRRLQAKTQVFPMPDDDHVHTRLTHSLEVASVGAGLGAAVAVGLGARGAISAAEQAAIAAIVGAACLAHDIGNPPFGHAGEQAIGHCFARGPGATWIADLTEARRRDLECFEGNAQGLRVLTRLDMDRDHGGMCLTAAVLAAFTKYPCASDRRDRGRGIAGKKHGFFQDDSEAFAAIAASCGLMPSGPGSWSRHPLAFLVEAADDLCYQLLDLEDGVRLRLITRAEAEDRLAELLDVAARTLVDLPLSRLRARALSRLIGQCAEVFLAAESAALRGELHDSLTDLIPAAPALGELGRLNVARCYRADQVVHLEQAGYNVLGGLLGDLLASAFAGRNERLARQIVPGLEAALGDPYRVVLAITDLVSGMSDRQALRVYRQISGIAFAGMPF